MMMENLSDKTLVTIASTAFVATEIGDFKKARMIFEGIEAIRPDANYFKFGHGVVLAMSGDYSAANKKLEHVLDIEPDYVEARCWLAWSTARSGREADGRQSLMALMESESDFREMAKSLIADLDDNPPDQ